ncbi:hypothetical protein MICAE_360021 [Microcystis aeruginosa PCC 9806]|nr:hypothetical protein MICAE_360021 [Microcystis aeruginosa PCC 9806]
MSLQALVKPILAVTAVKLSSNQLSVISYQLSVISGKLRAESYHSKVNYQYSAFHVTEVSTSFANKGFKSLAHASF